MINRETVARCAAGWRLPAIVFTVAALGAFSFVRPGGSSGGTGLRPWAPSFKSWDRLRVASASSDLAGQEASSKERFFDGGSVGQVLIPSVAAQDAPKKIVRSATLSVEVSDEPRARSLARAAAAQAGASLESDTSAGGERSRCATLTFKVAPERFEALVGALEKLGRVGERTLSAQNMGAEYVDLRSRLANLRRVEKRLHELLSFRTAKLADVLSVEKELERIGGEIETLEGRMKYIDALAAASTVTVTLSEPAKDQPSGGILVDIRNAGVGALNTFVSTGLALLRLTSWLAALSLWVLPISLGLWKLKKRWCAA